MPSDVCQNELEKFTRDQLYDEIYRRRRIETRNAFLDKLSAMLTALHELRSKVNDGIQLNKEDRDLAQSCARNFGIMFREDEII